MTTTATATTETRAACDRGCGFGESENIPLVHVVLLNMICAFSLCSLPIRFAHLVVVGLRVLLANAIGWLEFGTVL